jgi:hypothetical protein
MGLIRMMGPDDVFSKTQQTAVMMAYHIFRAAL